MRLEEPQQYSASKIEQNGRSNAEKCLSSSGGSRMAMVCPSSFFVVLFFLVLQLTSLSFFATASPVSERDDHTLRLDRTDTERPSYHCDINNNKDEVTCLGMNDGDPAQDAIAFINKNKIYGELYLKFINCRFPGDALRRNWFDFEKLWTSSIRVKKLRFESTLLRKIEDLAFENFTDLNTLTLKQTALTQLKNATFKGLSNLLELNIEENYDLRSCERGTLDLMKLSTLMVQETINDVGILQNLTGFTTTSVQIADLQFNSINVINDNSFSGLRYAMVFNLQSSNIKTIEENAFNECKDMVILRLSGNAISSLPANIFSSAKYLKILELHRNQLLSLPEEIFRFNAELDFLDLHNNQLKSLPNNIFSSCTKLRHIDLHNNQINRLPGNIFGFSVRLEHLDLSQNEIRNLPAEIFSYSPNLDTLELHTNQLMNLPEDIFQFNPHLQQLDLNSNHLMRLGNRTFASNQNLTSLNLGSNFIELLPEDIFQSNNKLELLYLDHNHLNGIPPRLFHESRKLVEVHLHENNLRTMSEGVFDAILITADTEILLDDNPWVCNCSLVWLQELLTNAEFISGDPECKYPPELESLSITEAGLCTTTSTTPVTSSLSPSTTEETNITSSGPEATTGGEETNRTDAQPTTESEPSEATTIPDDEEADNITVMCSVNDVQVTYTKESFKEWTLRHAEPRGGEEQNKTPTQHTIILPEWDQDFKITQSDDSTIVVETGGYLNTIIWTDGTNVNCTENVRSKYAVENINPETVYTFCITDASNAMLQPTRCRSLKTQPSYPNRAWLRNQDKLIVIMLSCGAIVIIAFVAAILTISLIKLKPHLIKSKKIIPVREVSKGKFLLVPPSGNNRGPSVPPRPKGLPPQIVLYGGNNTVLPQESWDRNQRSRPSQWSDSYLTILGDSSRRPSVLSNVSIDSRRSTLTCNMNRFWTNFHSPDVLSRLPFPDARTELARRRASMPTSTPYTIMLSDIRERLDSSSSSER